MRVWIVIIVCVVLAVLAMVLSRLNPPGSLTLAAGPKGGAYAAMAERYAEILDRDGIQLEIIETAGSVENAQLLGDGKVDAAFVQGGIVVPPAEVEAIGTLFFEPMIFITRTGADIPRNPALWRGLRINSGAQGSGTEAAFRDFENAVGLTGRENLHLDIPYSQAVDALLEDELDIAVFVAPVFAPYLMEAYEKLGVSVFELDHVQAISRRLPYASVVTLPAGGVSLDPVLPLVPEDMVALSARMVVRADFHPALVNRLTMAAIELHGSRSILSDAGTFPAADGGGLPVNKTARQLIQEGPSVWHNWLPYWIAAQVNLLLLLFLPLVLIVLPLLRTLPVLYRIVMRWRVWQHYPEIWKIEDELMRHPDLADLDALHDRLSELDEHLAALRLPASYRQVQYEARLHLEFVRKRISDMRDARVPAGEARNP